MHTVMYNSYFKVLTIDNTKFAGKPHIHENNFKLDAISIGSNSMTIYDIR